MKNDLHSHTILYMDDDRDDLQLLQDAFHRVGQHCRLLHAADGVEGLELLDRLRADGDLPCLIVLDINMPRLDGRRTFQQLRLDPAFAAIPVVIFSTSNSELDKLFFRGKDVEYITKPVDFQLLLDAASRMLCKCEEAAEISDIRSQN